jgi:hypothetical protein
MRFNENILECAIKCISLPSPHIPRLVPHSSLFTPSLACPVLYLTELLLPLPPARLLGHDDLVHP